MSFREIDGRYDPRLARELAPLWDEALRRGGVAYDPSHARSFRHGALTFHYIPGRDTRPGGRGEALARGLLTPHTSCPFDDDEALASRCLARFERRGRRYFVIANRFPVVRPHYLLLRPRGEAVDRLPQCLHGADEVEDAVELARMLGPGIRFYFNSNAGRDASSSGSTVNHWHFHVFPHATSHVGRMLDAAPAGEMVDDGTVLEGWPVPHWLQLALDTRKVAEGLWREVEKVTALDIAYNAEIAITASGNAAALLYPRRPLEPIEIPRVGRLSNRFGGWELSGDVVIYEEPLFDWALTHCQEAVEIAWRRLRLGTRNPWNSGPCPTTG